MNRMLDSATQVAKKHLMPKFGWVFQIAAPDPEILVGYEVGPQIHSWFSRPMSCVKFHRRRLQTQTQLQLLRNWCWRAHIQGSTERLILARSWKTKNWFIGLGKIKTIGLLHFHFFIGSITDDLIEKELEFQFYWFPEKLIRSFEILNIL